MFQKPSGFNENSPNEIHPAASTDGSSRGRHHRNPVEANFCWAMAHNSSAPALPTSHPERCALIAVLKPMGFCWCFFQGTKKTYPTEMENHRLKSADWEGI